jgi:hypothetical protein
MYKYRAFGLSIQSEIEISELESINEDIECDIKILFFNIHDYPDTINDSSVYYGNPEKFIVNIKSVALYVVFKGYEIRVYHYVPFKLMEIKTFLLGSVFGALLHQRSTLVLHGSMIEFLGRGVCFTGPSGVGKSTLMLNFLLEGHSIFSDDVCPVLLEEGYPWVVSSYPSAKIWEDALRTHHLSTSGLKSVMFEEKKYRYDIQQTFKTTSIKLNTVYILKPNFSDEISIHELFGSDKLISLIENTYRYIFVEAMNLKGLHFLLISQTINHIKVFEVNRGSNIQPRELFETIKKHMEESQNDYY